MRRRTGVAPAIVALLLAGCGEPPAESEVLRPVRSERVATAGSSRVREFAGVSRAGRETALSFRVPGRVDTVRVDVGDQVRRGELIARLEPRDYEIGVRRAQAALAQAEASARNAESDLDRVRGLWENGNASQNELDGALARAESTAAQVASAAEALEAARRQLAYTELRAPVDGSIATVDVEVDENVGQGRRIVLLTSGSRAEVEIAVPGQLIAELDEGDSATVTFDALPGRALDASVTEVGVAATGATTFPVTLRLERDEPAVRSGLSATVSFRFDVGGTPRIVVPPHAVGADRHGRFVFVVEPTDEPGVALVRRTPVEVGALRGDGLEIAGGLDEGQRIVTAGVPRLTDGQRVKTAGEPARR